MLTTQVFPIKKAGILIEDDFCVSLSNEGEVNKQFRRNMERTSRGDSYRNQLPMTKDQKAKMRLLEVKSHSCPPYMTSEAIKDMQKMSFNIKTMAQIARRDILKMCDDKDLRNVISDAVEIRDKKGPPPFYGFMTLMPISTLGDSEYTLHSLVTTIAALKQHLYKVNQNIAHIRSSSNQTNPTLLKSLDDERKYVVMTMLRTKYIINNLYCYLVLYEKCMGHSHFKVFQSRFSDRMRKTKRLQNKRHLKNQLIKLSANKRFIDLILECQMPDVLELEIEKRRVVLKDVFASRVRYIKQWAKLQDLTHKLNGMDKEKICRICKKKIPVDKLDSHSTRCLTIAESYKKLREIDNWIIIKCSEAEHLKNKLGFDTLKNREKHHSKKNSNIASQDKDKSEKTLEDSVSKARKAFATRKCPTSYSSRNIQTLPEANTILDKKDSLDLAIAKPKRSAHNKSVTELNPEDKTIDLGQSIDLLYNKKDSSEDSKDDDFVHPFLKGSAGKSKFAVAYERSSLNESRPKNRVLSTESQESLQDVCEPQMQFHNLDSETSSNPEENIKRLPSKTFKEDEVGLTGSTVNESIQKNSVSETSNIQCDSKSTERTKEENGKNHTPPTLQEVETSSEEEDEEVQDEIDHPAFKKPPGLSRFSTFAAEKKKATFFAVHPSMDDSSDESGPCFGDILFSDDDCDKDQDDSNNSGSSSTNNNGVPAAQEHAPKMIVVEPVAKKGSVSIEPKKIIEESKKIIEEPKKIIEEPKKIIEEPKKIIEEPKKIIEEPKKIIEEPKKITIESKPINSQERYTLTGNKKDELGEPALELDSFFSDNDNESKDDVSKTSESNNYRPLLMNETTKTEKIIIENKRSPKRSADKSLELVDENIKATVPLSQINIAEPEKNLKTPDLSKLSSSKFEKKPPAPQPVLNKETLDKRAKFLAISKKKESATQYEARKKLDEAKVVVPDQDTVIRDLKLLKEAKNFYSTISKYGEKFKKQIASQANPGAIQDENEILGMFEWFSSPQYPIEDVRDFALEFKKKLEKRKEIMTKIQKLEKEDITERDPNSKKKIYTACPSTFNQKANNSKFNPPGMTLKCPRTGGKQSLTNDFMKLFAPQISKLIDINPTQAEPEKPVKSSHKTNTDMLRMMQKRNLTSVEHSSSK